MLKRLLRRLFGLQEITEKTEFDAAVDDLHKTIEQIDRNIKIIRTGTEERRQRHLEQLDRDMEAQQQLKSEWEAFKKKLPTEPRKPEQ